MKNRKLQIGVMGPSIENLCVVDASADLARYNSGSKLIGRLLAEKKIIVLTGACDGVMEWVMEGAREAEGITIGFPGNERGSSNKFCYIEIIQPKNIGSFADAGILSSDALITIPGGPGTLIELGLAYRNKIPNVITMDIHGIYDESSLAHYGINTEKGFINYEIEPEKAVDLAIKLGKDRLESKLKENKNGK